jgi:hypothetical protein
MIRYHKIIPKRGEQFFYIYTSCVLVFFSLLVYGKCDEFNFSTKIVILFVLMLIIGIFIYILNEVMTMEILLTVILNVMKIS